MRFIVLDDLVSKTQCPHGLILVFLQLVLHGRFVIGDRLQFPVDQCVLTLSEDDFGSSFHV